MPSFCRISHARTPCGRVGHGEGRERERREETHTHTEKEDLPGGGQLDEDALARHARLLVQVQELVRLGHRAFRVKAQIGVDLECQNATPSASPRERRKKGEVIRKKGRKQQGRV